VGGGAEGVLLEVDLLNAPAAQQSFNINICNKVLVCVDVSEGGQVEEDGGQDHEGVRADVNGLQLGARRHLLGQHRDTVVRHVQLCEECE